MFYEQVEESVPIYLQARKTVESRWHQILEGTSLLVDDGG